MTEGIKCIICGETYFDCPHGASDIENYGVKLARKGVKALNKLQKIVDDMDEFTRWKKEANKEGATRRAELTERMKVVEDALDKLSELAKNN